jgi:hypothetical protein
MPRLSRNTSERPKTGSSPRLHPITIDAWEVLSQVDRRVAALAAQHLSVRCSGSAIDERIVPTANFPQNLPLNLAAPVIFNDSADENGRPNCAASLHRPSIPCESTTRRLL